MTDIRLKRFNMRQIRSDCAVLFCGRRGSGKSFCAKDLLYYHRDVPHIKVVNGSEHADPVYSQFVPPVCISSQFYPPAVDKFMQTHAERCIDPDNKPRALILLDDMMYDTKQWANSSVTRNLFFNGRHYNMLCVVMLQSVLGIRPELRHQADYIFLFHCPSRKERMKIYEEYCQDFFSEFEEFETVMMKATECGQRDDPGCLVIHRSGRSKHREDNVFWYKARDHGEFFLGSRALWREGIKFVDDGPTDNPRTKPKRVYRVTLSN